jgi:hypothetical protein
VRRRRLTDSQRSYDQNRERILRSKGWKVERISCAMLDGIRGENFKELEEAGYLRDLIDRLDIILEKTGKGPLCSKVSCDRNCERCSLSRHYDYIEYLNIVSPYLDEIDVNDETDSDS